jgi:hypothetical protein
VGASTPSVDTNSSVYGLFLQINAELSCEYKKCSSSYVVIFLVHTNSNFTDNLFLKKKWLMYGSFAYYNAEALANEVPRTSLSCSTSPLM